MTPRKKGIDPRVRLLKALRSKVHIKRRSKVSELIDGDPPRVKLTCDVCGWSSTEPILIGPKGSKEALRSKEMVQKLVRYWNGCGGTTFECDRCTRKHRDERYPLPKTNPPPHP
jgi:hypothetical protein